MKSEKKKNTLTIALRKKLHTLKCSTAKIRVLLISDDTVNFENQTNVSLISSNYSNASFNKVLSASISLRKLKGYFQGVADVSKSFHEFLSEPVIFSKIEEN